MKLPRLISVTTVVLSLCTGVAHAGRPLSVDDAGVNEVGAGHVEFWYARMPGKADVWTVAPAYSPMTGFEVSASLSRDLTGSETSRAIQGKLLLTPSNPDGCNFGISFGSGYVIETAINAPFLNGLASCNSKEGSVHLNLGVTHPEGDKNLGVWGIAFERDFGGIIGHIERFGQGNDRPSTQIGLRKEIVPGLQLDGTVGRYDSDTIYSIGVKKMF